MLSDLRRFLNDEYTVISLIFEGVGEKIFADEGVFCQTLLEMISHALCFSSATEDYRKKWLNPN